MFTIDRGNKNKLQKKGKQYGEKTLLQTAGEIRRIQDRGVSGVHMASWVRFFTHSWTIRTTVREILRRFLAEVLAVMVRENEDSQ